MQSRDTTSISNDMRITFPQSKERLRAEVGSSSQLGHTLDLITGLLQPSVHTGHWRKSELALYEGNGQRTDGQLLPRRNGKFAFVAKATLDIVCVPLVEVLVVLKRHSIQVLSPSERRGPEENGHAKARFVL